MAFDLTALKSTVLSFTLEAQAEAVTSFSANMAEDRQQEFIRRIRDGETISAEEAKEIVAFFRYQREQSVGKVAATPEKKTKAKAAPKKPKAEAVAPQMLQVF
jgi:hypothetical protein